MQYTPTYVSPYTKGRLEKAEALMGRAFTKGTFGSFYYSKMPPNQVL